MTGYQYLHVFVTSDCNWPTSVCEVVLVLRDLTEYWFLKLVLCEHNLERAEYSENCHAVINVHDFLAPNCVLFVVYNIHWLELWSIENNKHCVCVVLFVPSCDGNDLLRNDFRFTITFPVEVKYT